MKRESFLKNFIGLSFLPLVGTAKGEEKEALRFKKEFLEAWKRSEIVTLEVYNQMPDTRLGFKYEKDAFTFQGQFVHCINFTSGQISGRFSVADPYEKPILWNKLSKAEMANEIKQFYAWIAKVVNECPTKKLFENDDFAGETIPKWRMFYALENHIIHHRGQAVCYLRLSGVTPEGYYGW